MFSALFLVLAACGNAEENNQIINDTVEVEADESENNVNAIDNEELEDEADKPENTTKENESEDNVSREYKNALKSAENYLSMMGFSEKGLFDQLTSEYGDQFPDDAAQYAIDNVEVDYNQQALKVAENYLELMPMSDNELFDQLISEYGDNFTEEQAQYAIDNLPE